MLAINTARCDAMAALEGVAATPLARLVPQLAAGLAAALAAYVPLHELLHALGCVAVGGRVTRIEIAPLFGGALLARVLPIVSPATEHAGRLAAFDVGGSDLRLLAVDVAPYLLTILAGVPFLRRLRRRPRAWLVPAAWVLALAPWINLPGDYYEMGSTIVTAALASVGSDWTALRSDDLPRLCAALWRDPTSFGATTAAAEAAAAAVVGTSLALGLGLAGATYGLGVMVAERLPQRRNGGATPRRA